MSGCCDRSGYRGVFNTKTAERYAKTFRQKGLDSTAAPMVAALRSEGVDGASVLEVGAGAGTAVVSLLEAGASSVVAFEISDAFERPARLLREERGIEAPVEWHTSDFMAMADTVDRAEVVFLNRVVCCYPDMEELVGAVASKSTRLVAMSYPRDRWPFHLFIRIMNAWLRFRKNSFRIFLHDPDAVAAQVSAAGLREAASGTTPGWHWKVWERVGS